jgi:hypothetical protein
LKKWRAVERPVREVFFPQDHDPGELCQSDFTHCRARSSAPLAW